MRRPIVSVLVAVALPALLLVGCGGSDDPGGGVGGTDEVVLDPDADLDDDTEADGVTEEDTVTDDATSGDPTDDPDDAASEDATDDDASGTHLAGPEALEPRVQEAIAQLLDGGVERDAITLVVAEPVVWSDGSLGCPEPGMMYTQALVEGYRIVLEVDGEEVAFHGAGNQPPFRCDGPVEPVSGGSPSS
jgi:hypothetical protein